MKTFCQPTLPPLYFEENAVSNSSPKNNNEECLPDLPPEILSLCLSKFANWGDLAKLACVQKSWSNILIDASSHSTESKWQLAQALLEGKCGLERNPARAMTVLRELAKVETDEQGVPVRVIPGQTSFAPAIKKLSECYFDGNGVEQNSEMGLSWLKVSFRLGKNVDAAHETALIYEYGRNNIPVDVVAAAQWFQEAAEEGHVEAMSELGLCYELGCGVEQCDEQALDWYTKAANLGHVTSKFSVGEAFEEARGVPQSDEEACLWYYRAALVGDDDSKAALRRLYDIARIVVPGVASILNE